MDNLPKKKDDLEILPIVQELLPEDKKLTPEEIEQVKKSVSNLQHGAFASLPIVCHADNCPYKDQCPLAKLGKAPEGERCPIELAEIKVWTQRWIDGLQIDVDDIAQIYLVRQLVEAEILEARANNIIAMEGFIKEVIYSKDPITGEAMYNYELSVPMDLKLKLKNRVDKILKALVATKEDRLKYHLKEKKINNDRIAEIVQKIQKGEIEVNKKDKR